MATIPNEEITLVKKIAREAQQKTVDIVIRYTSMGIFRKLIRLFLVVQSLPTESIFETG